MKGTCRLTPGTFTSNCRLDIDSHGWKNSNGDSEDEAHRQSHHPNLIRENKKSFINILRNQSVTQVENACMEQIMSDL